MRLFAISSWVQVQVQRKHKVEVALIPPCLDTELFSGVAPPPSALDNGASAGSAAAAAAANTSPSAPPMRSAVTGSTEDEPLLVVLMIRPATPWRSPGLSLDVAQILAARFGPRRLRVETFGCELLMLAKVARPMAAADPGVVQPVEAFVATHHGIIGRGAVRALFGRAHLFLDLSRWQVPCVLIQPG